MSANILGVASVIETLEPRLAPAGTVILSTVGNILTITGDTDNNGIRITDGPGTGNWSIADALAGTSYVLNGVAQGAVPFTIPAQNAIKAILGDGNDQMEIFPSTTPSGMVLSGVLSVNGGKGDDRLYLGAATTQSLQVQGATTIDMGEGADVVQANASILFAGTTNIKAGAGNDLVTFLSGNDHVFLKGLKVDLGAGMDVFATASNRFDVLGGTLSIVGAGLAATGQTVNLNPLLGTCQGAATIAIAAGNVALKIGTNASSEFRFGASLTISTGAGSDTVTFNGLVQVAGAVSIDMKDSNDNFTLAASGLAILGSLAVKGGNGDDWIGLNASSILTAVGAITLDLGTGVSVNMVDVNASHSLTAGSLTITGGLGNDTVGLAGAIKVFGAAVVDLKEGDNIITEAGGSLTVGSLALKTGAGADTISFQDNSSLQCSGLFSLALGAGMNDFESTANSVLSTGSLTYTAGATGDDSFSFTGAVFSVLGGLTWSAGSDKNTLEIQPTIYSFIGGALKLTGTAGSDSFSLTGPDTRVLGAVTVSFGDGSNDGHVESTSMNFGGAFSYTGGAGLDDFLIGPGKLTIAGALTIKVGNDTNDVDIIPSSGAIGSVNFTGGTGQDTFSLGDTNTIRLRVLGGVTAAAAAGQNSLVIYDCWVQGATSLQSTSAAINTDVAFLAGTVFNGPVTVNGGSGDTLLMVNDCAMRGAFTANLGAGLDGVHLDTIAGSTSANEWFGVVLITTGAGADTFSMGSNPGVADKANHFYKAVTLDGGAGTDTLVLDNNNTYVVPLVKLNIP